MGTVGDDYIMIAGAFRNGICEALGPFCTSAMGDQSLQGVMLQAEIWSSPKAFLCLDLASTIVRNKFVLFLSYCVIIWLEQHRGTKASNKHAKKKKKLEEPFVQPEFPIDRSPGILSSERLNNLL